MQNFNGLEPLPANVMLTAVFFPVVLFVGFAFGAIAEGEVELRLVVVEDGPTVLQLLVGADGIVIGAVVEDEGEEEEEIRSPEMWEGAAYAVSIGVIIPLVKSGVWTTDDIVNIENTKRVDIDAKLFE